MLILFGSHLCGGIYDTAVILLPHAGGKYKQPVSKLIHCFFIHITISPLNHSGAIYAQNNACNVAG